MKRNIAAWILTAFTLVLIPCYAYAGLDELPGINIKSYGNIVYEDENGSVEIYAEDIALLQEKLSSIPEEIFSPEFYSRIHDWKYTDVNDKNHTRQCSVCGTVITNDHKAVEWEECSFTYNNKTYDGHKLVCKCGYTWQAERAHNYVYTSLNADIHRVSCALDGTGYCEGMMEYEEEHTLKITAGTGSTHKVICGICMHERIMNCNFKTESYDEESGEERLECECGNYVVILEADPDPEPEPDLDADQKKDDGISSNSLEQQN